MGESPMLCVSGSHQSALSDNAGSTQDGPVKAFAYNAKIIAYSGIKCKYKFYLTEKVVECMIFIEVIDVHLNHNDVLSILPDRDPFAHKGDFGRVLLLCGSKGYTGAAALAAKGALRTGAGLVFLGVPESIYAIEAVKLTEPIVFSLPDENGMFSKNAIEQIQEKMTQMDAVLIGSGMGRSEGCASVLRFVLENFSGPVILDADGINLAAAHKDVIRRRDCPTILTPHAGEFIRFNSASTEADPEKAEILARELGAIVVLKGHNTVTTDGFETYINDTGNPGMAVGGSGDVLAGMITGLVGQGIQPLKAAAAAVWLHGASGDLCAKDMGQYAMLPTDLLKYLPRLMK